jgi:hypothetical protein
MQRSPDFRQALGARLLWEASLPDEKRPIESVGLRQFWATAASVGNFRDMTLAAELHRIRPLDSRSAPPPPAAFVDLTGRPHVWTGLTRVTFSAEAPAPGRASNPQMVVTTGTAQANTCQGQYSKSTQTDSGMSLFSRGTVSVLHAIGRHLSKRGHCSVQAQGERRRHLKRISRRACYHPI